MRFSKSQLEEIKNRVKLELAKNPKASCREIASALGYSYKFINFLKNKVHKEVARDICSQTVSQEIAKFELIKERTDKELWKLVESQATTAKEKISAIKTILDSNYLFFDKKLNSGLFSQNETKLKKTGAGIEDIREQYKELEHILRNLERIERGEKVDYLPEED
jgi:hypothetical protein